MAEGSIQLSMKICTGCGNEKPATGEFFTHNNRNKSGLGPRCKVCQAVAARDWRIKNPGSVSCSLRKYRADNTLKIKAAKKTYRAKNKDKILSYNVSYYIVNSSREKQRTKSYRKANLGACRARARAKAGIKYHADNRYKLYVCISSGIRKHLNARGIGKNRRKWETLVGYSAADLRLHIERQFSAGMSWENYGLWHVDHVIPASSFKYESTDDSEFRACWARTNLRPLWAELNYSKGGKRTLLL